MKEKVFIATMLIFTLLLAGCFVFKAGKYQDDNPLEEMVEEVIRQKTLIDLDLTPNSPED